MDRARKRIALLVETSLGSGREILRGIADFSRKQSDWEVFHAASGLDDDLPDWIEEWQGDGVIARIQNNETVRKLEKLKVPVVDVLGLVDSPFPLVHVDDSRIADLVANYFLTRGFSNFGFFGIENENWSDRRAATFFDAGKQPVSNQNFFQSLRGPDFASQREFDRLRKWLRELPRPCGVMVCSDQRGPFFLEACRAEMISVPDDISVIGVDNDLALCELSSPRLSSVRGGHYRVGSEAAALLKQLLAGKTPPNEAIAVSPNGLVVRESSDSRAIGDPVIRAAIQALRERASTPITNDQLARAVGISRTSLQQRFRHETGQTIREFLTALRLKLAIQLIEQTDLTFPEIADRSGFKHHEYMGAVLREKTGKTPRQTRLEFEED